MPLIDQVQQDMVAAMKSPRRGALERPADDQSRAHEAESGFAQTDRRSGGDAILKIAHQAAHRCRGDVPQGGPRRAGRKEEAERALIESYLPAGASEEEIDAAIAAAMAETGATSIKQMGAVMKAVQAKLKGKTVDGKALSDKVRSKLS